jgi:molybdopterin biosynthesis enzyme MoaB
MARLPQPGADDGVWGDVLNDYLQQSLTSGGVLKPNVVSSSQLADNAVTAAAIADGTITEAQLNTALQTKVNSGSAPIVDGSVTKAKLSIAVQATLDKADSALQSAPVTSVAGKTDDVTLVKGDVGLGNVDNTSDAAKPISTATQTALDGKAGSTHTHTIADTTGLQAALNSKADATSVGSKVLLIDNVAALPPGTPAGVVVIVKA